MCDTVPPLLGVASRASLNSSENVFESSSFLCAGVVGRLGDGDSGLSSARNKGVVSTVIDLLASTYICITVSQMPAQEYSTRRRGTYKAHYCSSCTMRAELGTL